MRLKYFISLSLFTQAFVALGEAPAPWMFTGEGEEQEVASSASYPMDFYASDSLGPWTPNHRRKDQKSRREPPPVTVTVEESKCTDCSCNKESSKA